MDIPFFHDIGHGLYWGPDTLHWISLRRSGSSVTLAGAWSVAFDSSPEQALAELVETVQPDPPVVTTHVDPAHVLMQADTLDRHADLDIWVEEQVEQLLPPGVARDAFLSRTAFFGDGDPYKVVVAVVRRDAVAARLSVLEEVGLVPALIGDLRIGLGFAYAFDERFAEGSADLFLSHGTRGWRMPHSHGEMIAAPESLPPFASGGLDDLLALQSQPSPVFLAGNTRRNRPRGDGSNVGEPRKDGGTRGRSLGASSVEVGETHVGIRSPIVSHAIFGQRGQSENDSMNPKEKLATLWAELSMTRSRLDSAARADKPEEGSGENQPSEQGPGKCESSVSSCMVPAAALAMQQLYLAAAPVDFLDAGAAREARNHRDRHHALRFSLVVSVVIGGLLLTSTLTQIAIDTWTRSTASDLTTMKAQLEAVETAESRLAELKERLQQSNALVRRRTHAAVLLERIGRSVPRQVWLDGVAVSYGDEESLQSLHSSHGRRGRMHGSTNPAESLSIDSLPSAFVRLTGFAPDDGPIAGLLGALERQDGLFDIQLIGTTRLRKKEVRRFGGAIRPGTHRFDLRLQYRP